MNDKLSIGNSTRQTSDYVFTITANMVNALI